jgi:hypothetical protein
VEKEDDLRYDLGNLLAQDVQPLDLSRFKYGSLHLLNLIFGLHRFG